MISLPKNLPLGATVVGKPVNRVDGTAKVTGEARYAAEHAVPDLLHGFIVASAITRGRILRIDSAAAQQIAGVVAVITHENRPKTAWWKYKWKDQTSPPGSPFRPLQGPEILFADQPIALVIATSSELARHAASLVRVDYEQAEHQTGVRAHRAQRKTATRLRPGIASPPSPRGDADAAFTAAPVQVDAEYTTPVEHHNALELHASTVVYAEDGHLTIYEKTQGVQNCQVYIAHVFGVPKKKVRVLSPYVGGAFGSGLRPQAQLFLAVAAALHLKRSVRVVLTRQQNFGVGHRPETVQRIALGAGRDGKLQAMIHEVVSETSRYEEYVEAIAHWSALLYACPHTRHNYDVVPLDVSTPGDMRAPGGAVGVYGIECAMDEVAHQAGVDPLELRLRNYAERDEANDLDFSSKELRACYTRAAERFGWSRRSPAPRSMRDGSHLIGWGMASGVWEAMQMPAGARVTLSPEGVLTVSTATSDIGTGTYTILSQIAAEALGLPLAKVVVRLGDSDLPFSTVEGGSWTAASTGTAVMSACAQLRRKLLTLARRQPNSPVGDLREREVEWAEGYVRCKADPARGIALSELARASDDPLSLKVTVLPHLLSQRKFARYTHSAVFAEVEVDEDLGRVQVRRMVSAVAAGRILNPKTARSQVIGGMVWGIGMALQEETHTDHRLGRYLNHSLAEYHIPVHADIRDLDVIFVEETDAVVNPIGVKGVGEIGIVGVAAAIANAVFHATGKRVRDLPITLDKILRT